MYIGSNNHNAVIEDSIFTHNTVENRGGAVFVDGSDGGNFNMSIQNTLIESCIAAYGGGMYFRANNDYSAITNTSISFCSAQGGGGGVTFAGSTEIRIVNALVTGNIAAGGAGGGIHFDGNAAILISNTTVANNTAYYSNGGGIFLSNNTQVSIWYATINNNTVSYGNGGGMYLESTVGIIIGDCLISNNSAAGGGGVYFSYDNTAIRVLSVILKHNSALSAMGGGMYVDSHNADMILGGVTVSRNYAKQYGGGACFNGPLPNLVVTDLDSALASQQLQYKLLHANETGVLFNETVYNAHASGFVINFDPLTRLGMLFLEIISASAYYTGAQSNLPGVNAPSLEINGPRFQVILSCAYNGCAARDADFKMFVTPISVNSTKPTYFANNKADINGGGMYIYQKMSYALILNTNYFSNFAQYYGGGLYLFSSIDNLMLLTLLLERNHAETGGGIYMFQDITSLVMSQVLLEDNSADNEGGGWFININVGGTVTNCSFSGNAAYGGGGLAFQANQLALTFRLVDFSENSAYYGGGLLMNSNNGVVVFEYSDNTIEFLSCSFLLNFAVIRGAAVYMDTGNVVTFENTLFSNNSIGGNTSDCRGGGISMDYQNRVVFINNTFVYNSAFHSGGAISSTWGNIVTIQSCVFTENTAGVGAGISIEEDTTLQFVGTTIFRGNNASSAGGAIATEASYLWCLDPNARVIVVGNHASKGSALFFKSLLMGGCGLSGFTFEDNVATVGGTVYWLYDRKVFRNQEPPGLHSPTNKWYNNLAPYGNHSATQAVTLLGPDQYIVQIYANTSNVRLVYNLKDYYGHDIPLTGTTSVIPSTSLKSPYHCYGDTPPTITGPDTLGVVFLGGAATMHSMHANCYPGGVFSINSTAQLGDQIDILPASRGAPYYITKETHVTMRNCVAGEQIQSNVCLQCPNGTYSLTANVGATTKCKLCGSIPGVRNCHAAILNLKPNYWRRFVIGYLY